MAGVLVQERGVHQEMGVASVTLHLFLQNGIQIDGIIQGIETGKSLAVKKQICPAVLVVIFMELFQGLFRRFFEQPFTQKLFNVFNSLLPLLRGNRGTFNFRRGMLEASAGDGIPEASNPAARKRAEKNLFIPPDYFQVKSLASCK